MTDTRPHLEPGPGHCPDPYPAVAGIAGLVASYPDRLAVSAEMPES